MTERNGNHVFDVSEATFGRDVLERSYDLPVVVDFWAPWCGPCRMLGPVLERLAAARDGDFLLAKLNVDDNQPLAVHYGVQGIPAVKAFRDGEVVDEFVGALPEPQVRAFLDRLIPDERQLALQRAAALLIEKKWAAAAAAYRALDGDHRPEEALVGLAQALLGQGQGCAALEALAELSDPAAVPEVEWMQPLAEYLCPDQGAAPSQGEATGLEADYRRAAGLLRRGAFAAALEQLLAILQQDKGYADGRARQVVLAIFALLGDDAEATREYRPRLASILF